MKYALFASGALSLALTATPAQAVEGLSANVGVTSNYLWRGLEQTAGGAAVSGGIDYDAGNGFYLGTWVSNVDFGDDTSYEWDLYGGYNREFDNGLSFDLGYIYYAYPDGDDVDFSEIYASVGYSYFTLGLSSLASANWDSDFGDDLYASLDASFPVAEDLELGLHLGHYDFEAGGDYSDYGISLSKAGFTLGVSDTDMADDDIRFYVSYSLDIDL